MKKTMLFRPIANPRRTTLAHLEDAEEPRTRSAAADAEHPEAAPRPLPQQTANPRRTVLNELPTD